MGRKINDVIEFITGVKPDGKGFCCQTFCPSEHEPRDTSAPEFEISISELLFLGNPSPDVYNLTYQDTGGIPTGFIFFDQKLLDIERTFPPPEFEQVDILYPETSMAKATREGKTIGDIKYEIDSTEGLPAAGINVTTDLEGDQLEIIVYDPIPPDESRALYLDLYYDGEPDNKRRITFNIFRPA